MLVRWHLYIDIDIAEVTFHIHCHVDTPLQIILRLLCLLNVPYSKLFYQQEVGSVDFDILLSV